ncbi:MAG TPA: 16S rRNA (cytidine(1402)-2'-O)-methyltransferase [Bacteroidia bacterium]|nr:16S rRNA (cytidine(1402)-2'-O)-methyltransferase [Bacteroidia bacterium]
MPARVILIPTPIGNLEDITLRAKRLLQEADLVAAEDTRETGKLLKLLGIERPLTALHQHNEHHRVGSLLEKVAQEGLTLALVSDAGTPGISDPGFLLVREAIAAGIPVEALPGATAFVPALVASGLPCDRFVFEGFLPQKKGRKTRLDALHDEVRTMVFYESPFRILKLMEEMEKHFGPSRQVAVARELSKLHETYYRGTVQEVIQQLKNGVLKGEMVVVLAGKE